MHFYVDFVFRVIFCAQWKYIDILVIGQIKHVIFIKIILTNDFILLYITFPLIGQFLVFLWLDEIELEEVYKR